MKQMTCEMCGGTDLLKQEGVFVCQSCGTKYSVEEAKKMMVEGTVEVVGTVKVDSSSNIANYLKLAENAAAAGNNKESEDYCNRILEIAPENHSAWFLKGNAAGWQTTLKSVRLTEAYECFAQALKLAPEDEAEKVKKDVSNAIYNLSTAILNLACNHFTDFPGKDTANTVLSLARQMKRMVVQILSDCGTGTEDYEKLIALKLRNCVIGTWNKKIMPDYNGDEGRPSKYEWENFKDRAFSCIDILEYAVNYSKNDDKDDLQRYKDLITISKTLRDSCSWKVDFTQYGKSYKIEYTLNSAAKEQLNKKIQKYEEAREKIDPEQYAKEKETEAKAKEILKENQAKANEKMKKGCLTGFGILFIITGLVIRYLLLYNSPMYVYILIAAGAVMLILPFIKNNKKGKDKNTGEQSEESAAPDDEEDAKNNKAQAVAAYILFFVPMLTGAWKTSPFVRYHVNQGLLATILYAVYNYVIRSFLIRLLISSSGLNMTTVNVVNYYIPLALFAFSVIGILNAVKGEKKPLPIIGGITLIKPLGDSK